MLSVSNPSEQLMEIVSLPPPTPDDPYLDLFYQSLVPHGIRLCSDRQFNIWWLFRNRTRVGAFHFHWLHLFYDASGLRAALRFSWFLIRVLVLKAAGFRIFFTLHNLESHEKQHPILDALSTRSMLKLADLTLVHGSRAAMIAKQRYPRSRIESIPYFCSASDYPRTISREKAQARLGVADAERVFIHLGKIREYKGLDDLIRAFRVAGKPSERLILAGRPENARVEAQLSNLIEGDDRIQVHFRFIPREEVQVFLCASDVAVFPYREVFTVGSPGVAMGFGLPIIASRRGTIEDLVPEAGRVLFEPDKPGALAAALVSSRRLDLDRARSANLTRAADLGWDRIGAATAELFLGSCSMPR